jgi:hypothetical protein
MMVPKELGKHFGVASGNEASTGVPAGGNAETPPARSTGTIDDFIGSLDAPGTPSLSIEEIRSMGWLSEI